MLAPLTFCLFIGEHNPGRKSSDEAMLLRFRKMTTEYWENLKNKETGLLAGVP